MGNPRKKSKRQVRAGRVRNDLEMHRGRKLRVPNHPTEFTAVPWYSLTVRILNPTGSITYGQIYSNLISQLVLTFPSGTVNVRLLQVMVWGPIPTTNARLTVTFKDVFDNVSGSTIVGAQMTLDEVSNYADQVNRARVGYKYSTIQQQKSLFMTTGAPDEVCEIAGAGNGAVAYIKLLWRPYRLPGPPPALEEDWAYL